MEEKLVLLEELAVVPGLVFCGSVGLFIQGIVPDFKDIDVLVPNFNRISQYFTIKEIEENVFKFEGRKRAVIVKNNVIVDIFAVGNITEETIQIGNKNCVTVEAQIDFFEKIKNYFVIPNDIKKRFNAQLNFLKNS